MEEVSREQTESESAARLHDRAALADIGAKIQSIIKARSIKRFTDAITFIVLLFGLFFTYEEAKRGSSTQNLSNWSDVTARTFDVDKAFVDYPEYQKYFYDGVIIEKGKPNYDRAYALSVLELDFIDSVTTRLAYNKGHISEDILQPEAWYKFIDSLLRTAPLMCEILMEAPDSYGEELRRVGLPPCMIARANRLREVTARPNKHL